MEKNQQGTSTVMDSGGDSDLEIVICDEECNRNFQLTNSSSGQLDDTVPEESQGDIPPQYQSPYIFASTILNGKRKYMIISIERPQIPTIVFFPEIRDLFGEVRRVMGTNYSEIKIQRVLRRYLRRMRDYEMKSHKFPNKCRMLAKNICRTIYLFRSVYDYFDSLSPQFYFDKITELVGIYIFLELRVAATSIESKVFIADRIVSNLFIHKPENEKIVTFVLRVFSHIPYISRQTHIVDRVFRLLIPDTAVLSREELTDQLYAQYLIAFHHWKDCQLNFEDQLRVITLANKFMQPPDTLKENMLYIRHLPIYDEKEDATEYYLHNLVYVNDIRRAALSDGIKIVIPDNDQPNIIAVVALDGIDLGEEVVIHERRSVDIPTIDLTESNEDAAWLKRLASKVKNPGNRVPPILTATSRIYETVDISDSSDDEVVEIPITGTTTCRKVIASIVIDEEEDDIPTEEPGSSVAARTSSPSPAQTMQPPPTPMKTTETMEVMEPIHQVESVEPMEAPIQPMEPIASMDPQKPMQPIESIEQPMRSMASMKSVEPQPEKLMEPIQSIEPLEEVESLEQTESMQTVESVQSVESMQTVESMQPIETIQEMEPEQPLESLQQLQSLTPLQAVIGGITDENSNDAFLKEIANHVQDDANLPRISCAPFNTLSENTETILVAVPLDEDERTMSCLHKDDNSGIEATYIISDPNMDNENSYEVPQEVSQILEIESTSLEEQIFEDDTEVAEIEVGGLLTTDQVEGDEISSEDEAGDLIDDEEDQENKEIAGIISKVNMLLENTSSSEILDTSTSELIEVVPTCPEDTVSAIDDSNNNLDGRREEYRVGLQANIVPNISSPLVISNVESQNRENVHIRCEVTPLQSDQCSRYTPIPNYFEQPEHVGQVRSMPKVIFSMQNPLDQMSSLPSTSSRNDVNHFDNVFFDGDISPTPEDQHKKHSTTKKTGVSFADTTVVYEFNQRKPVAMHDHPSTSHNSTPSSNIDNNQHLNPLPRWSPHDSNINNNSNYVNPQNTHGNNNLLRMPNSTTTTDTKGFSDVLCKSMFPDLFIFKGMDTKEFKRLCKAVRLRGLKANKELELQAKEEKKEQDNTTAIEKPTKHRKSSKPPKLSEFDKYLMNMRKKDEKRSKKAQSARKKAKSKSRKDESRKSKTRKYMKLLNGKNNKRRSFDDLIDEKLTTLRPTVSLQKVDTIYKLDANGRTSHIVESSPNTTINGRSLATAQTAHFDIKVFTLKKVRVRVRQMEIPPLAKSNTEEKKTKTKMNRVRKVTNAGKRVNKTDIAENMPKSRKRFSAARRRNLRSTEVYPATRNSFRLPRNPASNSTMTTKRFIISNEPMVVLPKSSISIGQIEEVRNETSNTTKQTSKNNNLNSIAMFEEKDHVSQVATESSSVSIGTNESFVQPLKKRKLHLHDDGSTVITPPPSNIESNEESLNEQRVDQTVVETPVIPVPNRQLKIRLRKSSLSGLNAYFIVSNSMINNLDEDKSQRIVSKWKSAFERVKASLKQDKLARARATKRKLDEHNKDDAKNSGSDTIETLDEIATLNSNQSSLPSPTQKQQTDEVVTSSQAEVFIQPPLPKTKTTESENLRQPSQPTPQSPFSNQDSNSTLTYTILSSYPSLNRQMVEEFRVHANVPENADTNFNFLTSFHKYLSERVNPTPTEEVEKVESLLKTLSPQMRRKRLGSCITSPATISHPSNSYLAQPNWLSDTNSTDKSLWNGTPYKRKRRALESPKLDHETQATSTITTRRTRQKPTATVTSSAINTPSSELSDITPAIRINIPSPDLFSDTPVLPIEAESINTSTPILSKTNEENECDTNSMRTECDSPPILRPLVKSKSVSRTKKTQQCLPSTPETPSMNYTRHRKKLDENETPTSSQNHNPRSWTTRILQTTKTIATSIKLKTIKKAKKLRS